jgi:hypothetical protein
MGNKILAILSIVLGITGLTIVAFWGSRELAVGIFLMIWGNNIMLKQRD